MTKRKTVQLASAKAIISCIDEQSDMDAEADSVARTRRACAGRELDGPNQAHGGSYSSGTYLHDFGYTSQRIEISSTSRYTASDSASYGRDGDAPVWIEASNGLFIAATEDCIMTVHRSCADGWVNFQVRYQRPPRAGMILGSGIGANIVQAMTSAERMAAVFRGVVLRQIRLVMVVDDDTAVREAVADVLRDDGFFVAEAATGEAALEAVACGTLPSVIITDVDLGDGISGIELARRLADAKLPIKVLLISGEQPPPAAEGFPFLAKPFCGEELLLKVTALAQTAHRDISVH